MSKQKFMFKRDAKVIGDYRYILTRIWDEGLEPITFFMLNPSIADGNIDDNTVRKCMQLAHYWHESGKIRNGGINVINLFAYRATDVEVLIREAQNNGDIVGPENDIYIRKTLSNSKHVVLAWGNNVVEKKSLRELNRVDEIMKVLKELHDTKLYCLKKTGKGCPNHPLFLPDTTVPQEW